MSHFQTLPNELIFNIVSRLGMKDITDLSRTCKAFYHYCQSREVSSYLVKSELEFSPEFAKSSDPEQIAVSAESALRRVVKRREALSEAKPFSVAILGFCSFYLYRNKWLWYIHNTDIRGLQLSSLGKAETGSSAKTELVINYRKVLDKTAFAQRGFQEGSFSLLHFQDEILSCLYRLPARQDSSQSGSESDDSEYEEREPVQPGWLIVLDVRTQSIVFRKFLRSTKNIFARHATYTKTDTTTDSKNGTLTTFTTSTNYLYYGYREPDHFDKRHRWTLNAFDLTNATPVGDGSFCYLFDIDGFELDSTVCFEIIDGRFYAVTSQSTYRAQEIDWSSFYHCISFPINKPCREELERTEERSMWRRQHSEGPVDDRWSTLSISRDEKSGELIIVECRKELVTGKRTAYKTNIVFPPKKVKKEETAPDSPTGMDTPKPRTTFVIGGGTPQDEEARRLELLSLTQDRVALTLEDQHMPRFLAPQGRLAANVHAEPADNTFNFSATLARGYNVSTSCFLDLVTDLPRHDPTVKQCLRLRSCTRRPGLPPMDENGIIQFASDAAGNDVYADIPASFWPPPLPAFGEEDQAVRQLHELLNPPGYQGKVTGTFDDTSLIYSIGKEGTQKALVFINFDASLRLPGLKRWDAFNKHGGEVNAAQANALPLKGKRVFNDMHFSSLNGNNTTPHELRAQSGAFPQRKKRRSVDALGGVAAIEEDVVGLTDDLDDQGWLSRQEPALYLSVGQGFDFSA